MGRMILCTSDKARIPYVFPVSEAKVYTIEELCYYIYHNIYEITLDCFNEKLVTWLKNELGMDTIAKKLHNMIEAESGLKDRVISIMCSCDYYTEEDIKALLHIISDMENMPYHGRMKTKADYLMKYGKYALAKRTYDKILDSGFAVNLSPAEYGDILHNRSIACFYTGAYAEAIQGFKDAYSRNNNPETLRHYLHALLLNSEKEKYENEILRYEIGGDEAKRIVDELSDAFVRAENSAEYKELVKIFRYGKEDKAYRYAEAKLEGWKRQYREGNI
ncbi:MAG: hypothetical protein HFH14_07655 [Lachnospiraceae bacterium]|nr:hypothetical protein [Lachnospiraceae bacterium]